MSVRILHAADLHMDSPFDSLTEEKSILMRKQQRLLLKRIADLCESEQIQIVLLSGDLLDSTASFHETEESLIQAFKNISAKIFISPGNHDYYCQKSPYASMDLPDNVYIFNSPIIKYIELPSLGCRIWGAGFNAPLCPPLLAGFSIDKADDLIDIMVMHGDTSGGGYNNINEKEIAASGLNYLALGHIHSFSGIKKAGNTYYAYPGCPEGRGFDELGEKGVIIGDIGKDTCDLRFVPICGHKYCINEIDVTDKNILDAISDSIGGGNKNDICRIVLKGETDQSIDPERIAISLRNSFFHVTVRDETSPLRNIWEDVNEDTLKGVFTRKMMEKYEAADEADKKSIEMALLYGLAALENREEWRV